MDEIMDDIEADELLDPSAMLDPNAMLDPTSLRDRIDQALETLAQLKQRKDHSVSRTDIVDKLCKDLSEYYGYIPELTQFMMELFSPAECVEYMDASDKPRPLVIRANTLKTTRKDLMETLKKRGCNVEPIDWSPVAIKVSESAVPIGATPEYLAGHYMLQSASSMNPVLALAPVPGERVLDMSAAPGGKTSYIAQLLRNSGAVIANDLKPQRQKATVANLHRLGVKNAIVCCYDGRKLPQVMKSFDRVLLDAPCSGLGVIARDQSVKIQRTVKDIQRMAHLQKELLCAAVDCCDHKSKTGGVVVYSTCSISSEENEQVIDYILRKRYVRLVDTGLQVGKPGFTRHKEKRFHPSLTLTRRFYPHVHNMDGFYVAKLVKYKHGVKSNEEAENELLQHEDEISMEDVEFQDDDLPSSEEGEENLEIEEEEEEEEEVVPVPAKKGGRQSTPTVATPAPTKAVEPEPKKSAKKEKAVVVEEAVEEPVAPIAASGKKGTKRQVEPVAEPITAAVVVEEEEVKPKKSKKTKPVPEPEPESEAVEEEDDDEDDEEGVEAVLAALARAQKGASKKKRPSIKELRLRNKLGKN